MTSDDLEQTIEIEALDRRSLVVMLCHELNRVLTTEQAWEQGCVLHHWEATASSFETLPADVIEVALEAWENADSRLDQIECSGYLETDEGVRAWGFVAVRPHQTRIQHRPNIDNIDLQRTENGYRFRARVTRQPRDLEAAE